MENKNELPVQWFTEALFGMFIHWGPYAVAGRGEWVMNRERIPHQEYAELYAERFLAEKFDPDDWADLAVEAGMKYVVFTTRHHDGFAMWDTATSDFNSVRMGPRRDIVKLLADAVRKRGLKLGFYYSMADWRHPDYPGAYYRDWPTAWKDEESERRFADYYRAQLKELMTGYGKVDLLWYDGCIPLNAFGQDVNLMVKQLQPGIQINNRHGIPFDFQCSEQTIKPAARGVPWEACMTLNGSWGYHENDHDYKTSAHVVSMLIETSSKGGNLLLNVGPDPDGVIPQRPRDILREVGDWLSRNGSSLHGTSSSPFSWNTAGCHMTIRGNEIIAHLTRNVREPLCLAEFRNPVRSVRLLATGEQLRFKQDDARLFVYGLSNPLPDPVVTTLVLDVEGPIEPALPQTTFWIPG